ncbi:hypothetical protein AMTR_s00025p00241690 [Amborella trichopoda]|uniref:HTH three-helical bundle domain-containing protein n=1 Tax=Amborella trichopoda TaxID=13333 RepID=W1PYR1_AMBTC|nr:hypothetical protein AMTR_s00025p00241690 [Amborella trichopoda]
MEREAEELTAATTLLLLFHSLSSSTSSSPSPPSSSISSTSSSSSFSSGLASSSFYSFMSASSCSYSSSFSASASSYSSSYTVSATNSDSYSSSVTVSSPHCISRDIEHLLLLATAALDYEFELKVVKRSRSKRPLRSNCTHWRSDLRKLDSKPSMTEIEVHQSDAYPLQSSQSSSTIVNTEEASQVKVTSMHNTSNYWRFKGRYREALTSPRLRRCADAIINLLSSGNASETSIRQIIGNSPDTSKALRV